MTLYPNVYVATCLQVVAMMKYESHTIVCVNHAQVRLSYTETKDARLVSRGATHETFMSLPGDRIIFEQEMEGQAEWVA